MGIERVSEGLRPNRSTGKHFSKRRKAQVLPLKQTRTYMALRHLA